MILLVYLVVKILVILLVLLVLKILHGAKQILGVLTKPERDRWSDDELGFSI